MASAPTTSVLLLLLSLQVLTVLADEVALFSHRESTLERGESLANNGSTLTLQDNCDLVLRDFNDTIKWHSKSIVKENVDCSLWINKYGVAVISDSDGIPLWTTGKPGIRGNYVVLLLPDGKLHIYGPSLWTFSEPESSTNSNDSYDITLRTRHPDSRSSFDSSGYIMYSSIYYIDGPSDGIMLKKGNYALVLDTTCAMHIRQTGDLNGTDFTTAERRALRDDTTSTCRARLTNEGELAAYKLLFQAEGGLDPVWLRTWGSDITVRSPESIAALVDDGELLIYAMKEPIPTP